MKSLLSRVSFCLLLVLPAEAGAGVQGASTFTSCRALNRVWPTGVAVSWSAARRQAVRPRVDAVKYRQNVRLDGDRDGTACEVSRAPSTTSTTTTTTTTTLPLDCPSSQNVRVNIVSATDISYRTTGISVRMYYYTRRVVGTLTNTSSSAVTVVLFTLAGNLLSNGQVMSTKEVEVLFNVTLRPGSTYGWSVDYEANGHRSTWSDYSPVVRAEAVRLLAWDAADPRCADNMSM